MTNVTYKNLVIIVLTMIMQFDEISIISSLFNNDIYMWCWLYLEQIEIRIISLFLSLGSSPFSWFSVFFLSFPPSLLIFFLLEFLESNTTWSSIFEWVGLLWDGLTGLYQCHGSISVRRSHGSISVRRVDPIHIYCE